MPINNAIEKRRSVRKYLPRQVSDKLVLEVLTAAGWAPSAHNSQPWRFIVISDLALKRELSLALVESWAEDLAKDGLPLKEQDRQERFERYAKALFLSFT